MIKMSTKIIIITVRIYNYVKFSLLGKFNAKLVLNYMKEKNYVVVL